MSELLPPRLVGVVIDPEHGDKLVELAARMPLWVADSATNRAAAEQYWVAPSHELTLFLVRPKESAEDTFVRVLATVDLHHNELAQQPPYHELLVVGVAVSDAVRAALARYRLSVAETIDGGFRAAR